MNKIKEIDWTMVLIVILIVSTILMLTWGFIISPMLNPPHGIITDKFIISDLGFPKYYFILDKSIQLNVSVEDYYKYMIGDLYKTEEE